MPLFSAWNFANGKEQDFYFNSRKIKEGWKNRC
jgi:hypothetical protein